MSERKIYVFGNDWAGEKVSKKYLKNKVVFLDSDVPDKDQEYPEIMQKIKQGDIRHCIKFCVKLLICIFHLKSI